MLRLLFIIPFLLFTHSLSAQSTFSTIVDLGYGTFNYSRDMALADDKIYVLSRHNCGDNFQKFCGSLAAFDKDGNLLSKEVQEGLILEGRNCLLVEEGFVLSGHLEPPTTGRGVDLILCDKDFQFKDVYSYHFGDQVAINNKGLILHQGAYYIYGQKIDYERDTSYGHIIKIDSESKELLWEKEWQNGGRNADVFDLQADSNGNLVFFNQLGRYDEEFEDLFVEIDTSGNVIYDYGLPRQSAFPESARFIIDSESNLYFYYGHNLAENSMWSFSTLHKLNRNSNTIEWDLSFPANLYNSRMYEIFDYIFDENDDIIACGTVSNFGEENEDDHDEHGFLSSFTKSGELNWLRLYKLVNDNPSFADNKYYTSALYHLRLSKETGGIIASGATLYFQSPSQWKTESWLLSLDSNGCLDGEECEEVIEVDGIVNSRNSMLDIHNEWKYQFDSDPSHQIDTWVRFVSEDLDTFGTVDRYRKLETKNNFNQNWQFSGILLREQFGQVWRSYNPPWPSDEYEYLIYDFNLEEGDEFETRDLDEEPIYLIVTKTDSIVLKDGTTRKRLFLQCKDNPEAEERIWIEGIGDLNGLFATQTACSNQDHSTELLCFHTSGQVLYEGENSQNCEYVPTTSTSTYQETAINIFPNPAKDKIFIQNIDCTSKITFTIKDALGQMHLKSSCQNEIDISSMDNGIYFLSVEDGGRSEVYKFVKL